MMNMFYMFSLSDINLSISPITDILTGSSIRTSFFFSFNTFA